jgi:hypothetical protein
MKLIAAIVLCLTAITVNAQQDITETIVRAFKFGDAAVIGAHLVPSVDLAILDEEDMVPRDLVIAKLDQFFQRNEPRAFELKHQGTSKLDDHYRIGDLTTSTGIYRVTFFMKKNKTRMEIKQLRIERYD